LEAELGRRLPCLGDDARARWKPERAQARGASIRGRTGLGVSALLRTDGRAEHLGIRPDWPGGTLRRRPGKARPASIGHCENDLVSTAFKHDRVLDLSRDRGATGEARRNERKEKPRRETMTAGRRDDVAQSEEERVRKTESGRTARDPRPRTADARPGRIAITCPNPERGDEHHKDGDGMLHGRLVARRGRIPVSRSSARTPRRPPMKPRKLTAGCR